MASQESQRVKYINLITMFHFKSTKKSISILHLHTDLHFCTYFLEQERFGFVHVNVMLKLFLHIYNEQKRTIICMLLLKYYITDLGNGLILLQVDLQL